MWPVLSVFVGGGVGALLRWFLAIKFNPAEAEPAFPFGTLAANLGGAFLIGLLLAAFALRTDWPEETRLLLNVGFLGGLTTFSTFSAEVVQLLAHGRLGLGFITLASNLCGSLALAAFGLVLGRLIFKV